MVDTRKKQIVAQVTEIARRVLQDLGMELDRVEFNPHPRHATLRVFVEKADGVGVEDCASISRELGAILDVEDPIDGPYTLEVSSPGLDRKLYGKGDYDRYVGHRVKIRMAPSFRTHRSVVGELLGWRNDLIRIFDDSGQEIELPITEISEARLEVDWTSILKEGKARS